MGSRKSDNVKKDGGGTDSGRGGGDKGGKQTNKGDGGGTDSGRGG